MKRIISLAVIGATVLSICSCNTDNTNETTIPIATSETPIVTETVMPTEEQANTSASIPLETTPENSSSSQSIVIPDEYYPVIDSIVDCIDNFDPAGPNTYYGNEYGDGIWELCSSDNSKEIVGYAFADIDGDNVAELAILDCSDPHNRIIELYTYSAGEVIHVIGGGFRCRYYLTNDMKIYNEGSSGADYSSVAMYELDNVLHEISFIDSYYTVPANTESDEWQIEVFHTTNQQNILSNEANSTDTELISIFDVPCDFYSVYGLQESDFYTYDSITTLAEYSGATG